MCTLPKATHVLGGSRSALGPSRNHNSTFIAFISAKNNAKGAQAVGSPGWEVLSSGQDEATTHPGRSLPPDDAPTAVRKPMKLDAGKELTTK